MALPEDTTKAEVEGVVSLLREGWDHLRLQSPLAAWGSWQKAIRLDPDSVAARQALATLESAGELPAAARTRYRFHSPATTDRRERWDARLRGSNPEAITDAAGVFSDLTEQDSDDAEAWYNRGLCLSWIGQNREAIGCFDRFVTLQAGSEFEKAVEAWTLAEVLRQGRGAEALADELRFTASTSWSPEDSARFARHFPTLRRIPTPIVPASDSVAQPALNVFEWLDRPISEGSDLASEDSIRGNLLLATIYESERSLRLSSPRADTLEMALERLAQVIDLQGREVLREASPLPLPFLDASVWTFRLPEGLDADIADRLTREHVESDYEKRWIHGKRHGLDGRSPLEASVLAASGDKIALAKLSAVIRLREQLATRTSVGFLYQGYPFDRVRTRLGLEPADGNSVDPDDLASASSGKLRKIDPTSLPDARLASAFESADALRDDQVTEKFAAELARRTPESRQGVDLLALTACLVRRHVSQGQSNQALDLIKRMESEGTEEDRRRLMTWRAEIYAREGQDTEATALYRELVETDPNPAIPALDASETLLDNNILSDAEIFLEFAIEAARDEGLRGVEQRARALLALLNLSA